MCRGARPARRVARDEGRSSRAIAAARAACVSMELDRRTEQVSRALLLVAARLFS